MGGGGLARQIPLQSDEVLNRNTKYLCNKKTTICNNTITEVTVNFTEQEDKASG